MVGGLVLLKANRLELEGVASDVEVPTQAFAEPVQHLTGAGIVNAGVVHNDVRGQHRYAGGNRQACRSWTSTTPHIRLMCSRTSARSTP